MTSSRCSRLAAGATCSSAPSSCAHSSKRRAIPHFDQHDEPAVEASPLLTRLHSFRGSQYDRIARLTYARVYEGLSLREVAAQDHSAPATLQKELQHFAVRCYM